MQPQIALVLFSIAVVILLTSDTRRKPTTSIALWIPLIWLAILASRSVEQWLDPSHGAFGANVEEGSTADRAVLSFLMVLATFTLARRQLRWVEWVKRNPWIFLFLLYCGISTVWSDFPAVAFKRWTRALGSVLMILVVLSEADPTTAVVTLVRRCAYILVPYSVLLIKYYRELAVVYNQWTGEEYLAGVTTDKNSLGRLCLIAGIFALWELIITRRGKNLYTMLNRSIGMIMFVVTVWLLVKSKSATSLGAFILGCGILIGLGLPVFRTRVKYLGTAVLLISVIVVGLNESFNLAQTAVEGLGRNMTFTERT